MKILMELVHMSYIILNVITHNTEISYGGVVQTGPNLNISFYDEFSLESISNKYLLIKDVNEIFYIYTDIAINIDKYIVKLGNFVANCYSNFLSSTLTCNAKIDNEGTYSLTIDGKEFKLGPV